MKTWILSLAALAALVVGGSAQAQTAAQPPVLQLPPPAPAVAQQPMAAPSQATAPEVMATGQGVPKSSDAATATARPVKRHAPVRRKTRVAAPPVDPYADLPVPDPAKEALSLSDGWAKSNTAVVSGGSEGRVVFVFGETMPTVVCAPLRMCVIELQRGEKVAGQPHVADPTRWSIAPGIVGEGDDRVVNVIVKPTQGGLDTNLLIPTNRRMYRLRLVSDENNYVSVVSFEYPQDMQAAWDSALAEQDATDDQVVSPLPSMSIDRLDFNYGIKVKRGSPVWTPVRVFTDGEKTYIQLPERVTAQDVPALVALSAEGQEQLVNFRLHGPYFIVDRVLERGALLSGVGSKGEVVEIEHGCGRRTAFGKCKG